MHAIEEQTARALQAVDLRLQLAAVSLAQAAASGPLGEAASRALLREQIRDLPFLRALWVMDAQGRIVQDSDVGNLGISLRDRAYFQVHLQAPQPALYVGDPVLSRSTGGWMINVSRPLASADGRLTGVVVAALQPAWFEQSWATVGRGSGDVAGLLRSDGTLMMRSPFDAAFMGRRLSELPLLKPPLLGAPAGSFEHASPVDGVRRLYAFRTVSTLPELRVLVGLELDGLLAPWRRVALVAGALWLIAAAVTGVLAYLLARDLSRRLAVEQRLRESEQNLSITLQSIGDAVITTDSEGRIDYMNPVAESLTGWESRALRLSRKTVPPIGRSRR